MEILVDVSQSPICVSLCRYSFTCSRSSYFGFVAMEGEARIGELRRGEGSWNVLTVVDEFLCRRNHARGDD